MYLQELTKSKKKIEILQDMGIKEVEDLVCHYPFRYEENICKPFVEWEKDDKVCFAGVVIGAARVIRYGYKKSYTKFKVLYDEIELDMTIFNRPWVSAFTVGKTMTFLGRYEGNYKVTCMSYNTQPLEEQVGVQPVYALKDGISQKEMRAFIQKALSSYCVEEFVPKEYASKYKLIKKQEALKCIHQPRDKQDLKQALRTLKYEEFLKFQLQMQYMKALNEKEKGVAKHFPVEKIETFEKQLPFRLTNGQKQAIEDILQDLQEDKVMYRLVQGDVGCGKTMVASFGMYACVLAHKQCALMAPTEILAKQHFQNLKKTFAKEKIRIEVLYSALPKKQKDLLLEELATGKIDIIVGTHALFQKEVQYANLGLVVADEQHRFGVKQRRMLLEKGDKVDFLLMSATPIPRTLAVSLYGDMDVSTIEELPKGRKEIITTYIKEDSMRSILEDILALVDAKQQCYIVCPAIEKNEEYAMRNVEELYANMNQVLGKKYKLQLLHGKMSSEEKEKAMEAFVNKEYQFLITTTVIEVGVDVKDANIMVIYDAHRFGMSQIHQLRGRVGRGEQQGYCYLLSGTKEPDAQARLSIVENTSDGFAIAKQDLALRGPGDLLGVRQSGISGFLLGDIIADYNMLEVSREDAKEILNNIQKWESIQRFIEKKDYTSYVD